MRTVIIANGAREEGVIRTSIAYPDKPSAEVFDDIHAMMSRVLFWNSIVFIEWKTEDEIDSSKNFVNLCMDFILENRSKLSANEYFKKETLDTIYNKYAIIEDKIAAYYETMEKENFMASNKTAMALIHLFKKIPPIDCPESKDGSPF